MNVLATEVAGIRLPLKLLLEVLSGRVGFSAVVCVVVVLAAIDVTIVALIVIAVVAAAGVSGLMVSGELADIVKLGAGS